MVLFLPFGIAGGFVIVTLAYLFSSAGASVAAVAALAGMQVLPNTWKALWAPIIDTTLTAKRWYLASVLLAAAGLTTTALLPLKVSLLPVFSAVVFATAFAVTFAAMSVERLMAFDTPADQKGRAGGWSQAGNLGGQGLGGGAGLWIAQHSHIPWLAGVSLGGICIACAGALLTLAEAPREADGRSYGTVLLHSAKDTLALVRSRIGILACFICVLPIGSGAAQNLWAAIAKDWHAGADEVALVGGLLSGLMAIVGSVAGGYFCDRVGRKPGYLVFGLLSAAAAVAMALGPRTPAAFLIYATIYNLGIGFVYGAFSALTLEAIGKGAAATKYNVVASISNMPILAMTLAEGAAQARWGSGGMLLFEAAMGVGAVTLYSAVAYGTRGLSWDVIFKPRAAGG